MTTRRKRLLGIGLAALVASGLWIGGVQSQSIQCGGSFVPSSNCTISGLWNLTSTNANGPIQVAGVAAQIVSKVTDISNAQMLLIDDAGVAVVPAPGVGRYIRVISVDLIFNYTAAYTVNTGDDLRLYWGSRSGGNAASATIETTGFLDATADSIIGVLGVVNDTDPPTTNAAVVLQGTSAVAFGGGNAANSVRVVVNYRIVTTGL